MSSPLILSFDIEEHHRIEAASGWICPPDRQLEYSRRMERTTQEILDRLAQHHIQATFFVVGKIAEDHPKLIRRMIDEGHEVGSHSQLHRRIHNHTPDSFRDDLLQSKDRLEQVAGERIYGFRAPTFSLTRQTAWAIDILADCGFEYDSSIFPVRHDRYGIPDAPRTPFYVKGATQSILEIPPLTLRRAGFNLPVAGGGYFRLFPLWLMKHGIKRMSETENGVSMLYFHPWEFDYDQPKIPLSRSSSFRTYVGIKHSFRRLDRLMKQYRFRRAIDVAQEIQMNVLPTFTPVPVAETRDQLLPALSG
jgi:polysaccharide deacetylase family protein (PEP-CTERM system associated)